MLIKSLKNNNLRSSLLFFLVALILFITKLINNKNFIELKFNHPLFKFHDLNLFLNPTFNILLSFVFAVLLSIGFNNLILDRAVLKKNTVLPAVFFVVILSAFNFSYLWITLFVILFIFNRLLSFYQKDRPYLELFDTGFLLGIGFLLTPTLIFFLPLLFFVNVIFGLYNWRSYIIPILGFLTPILFLVVYLYLNNNLIVFYKYYLQTLSFSIPNIFFSYKQSIFLFGLIFLIFLSLFELFNWISIKGLRSRKSFFVFFIYIILVFLTFFIQKNLNYEYIVFTIFPVSIFLANYFLYAKSERLIELLFGLFLFSALYLQF